jgi:hypothetical protein
MPFIELDQVVEIAERCREFDAGIQHESSLLRQAIIKERADQQNVVAVAVAQEGNIAERRLAGDVRSLISVGRSLEPLEANVMRHSPPLIFSGSAALPCVCGFGRSALDARGAAGADSFAYSAAFSGIVGSTRKLFVIRSMMGAKLATAPAGNAISRRCTIEPPSLSTTRCTMTSSSLTPRT